MSGLRSKDSGQWKCKAILRKYWEDITPFAKEGREAEFYKLFKPYEVIEMDNLLLNVGINALWVLVCGGTETAYNAVNAQLGVGNGATAAAATQTALQGANTLYKGMETTFPTSGTLQRATFRSSWGDAEANFVWNEWAVRNGATANKLLNRKVEALGTKTTGTWSLEVSITIS